MLRTARSRASWSGLAALGPFGVPAVLAAIASVAVLVAGTWTGAARVLVHQCLRLDGPVGTLGVRLQLLQNVADCPDGTLAVTPGVPQGAVLAFSLALPVLAAYTALGALVTALVALLLRAGSTAVRVLGCAVHALPVAPAPVPVDDRHGDAVLPRWERAPSTGAPGPRHPRRGPPVALA
ncbi:MAG TPA: hypothetical protein VGC67_04825 [Cellulomonas sp.]